MIFYYENKNINKIHVFTIKTDTKNASERWNFRQNYSKTVQHVQILIFFSGKTTTFKEKRESLFDFRL